MTLDEVKNSIKAEVLTKCYNGDFELNGAFCSDLMSDVLAFTKCIEDTTLLLTGLNNIQVVRTAEMLDVKVIAFVRGKKPRAEVITYAEAKGIVILSTPLLLYEAAGVLYSKGLGRKSV